MQAIRNASTCGCGLQNERFEELVRFETVIKTFNLCWLSSERDLALALFFLGIRFCPQTGAFDKSMDQVISAGLFTL
jgi:hypothetical protein